MDPQAQTPNEPSIAAVLDILARLESSRLDVNFSLASPDRDLVEAAERCGSYLPAIAYTVRQLIGADAAMGPSDNPLTNLSQVVVMLRDPVVRVATAGAALAPIMDIVNQIGAPIPVHAPSVREGFNKIREDLVAIAGIALRALRDGELAGWWAVTPEGCGVSATTIDVEQPAPFAEPIVDRGTDENALVQLRQLDAFLNERNGHMARISSDAIVPGYTVNSAIGVLASVGRVSPDQTESPFVFDTAHESPADALMRLATFVIERVPGEPSRSEGVVDTVIRVIRENS